MDYKNLFKKLARTLEKIEHSEEALATLHAILVRLVDEFRDDLGLVGGRIYVRQGSAYVLRREYPEGRVQPGFRLRAEYAPIRELLERGFVLRNIEDPGVSRAIERTLGVRRFAAIAVGDHAQYIIAFSLEPDADPEQVVYTLNTVRHVINIKLRQERLEDRFAETRAIQISLLPRVEPQFADFDVYGRTEPAEEVGGDLYDYIQVSDRILGIAVLDSAGHGLPAALQARDAIIGLRMGVEERMRITATVEKLNRVVARSALASRFISLFYGELEPNGILVYTNAGHPQPLLYHRGRWTQLDRGGLVLGPNPEAVYDRGYVHFEPGALLIAYTDGIVEAEDPRGRPFGLLRLKRLVRSRAWPSARALVDAVFDAVRAHSGADVPVDDQTVVVIRRR